VPIDLEAVQAAEPTSREAAWTERDVLLYHLSVGAGQEVPPRLERVYEAPLRVLPTFAVVAGQGISAGATSPPRLSAPGLDIDLRRILHAGQALEVHRPLPPSGRARISSRVADVWDKGKAAVVVFEQSAVDEDDRPLWTIRMQVWARGEGGFGGDPGPSTSWSAPERDPDHVLETVTRPDQALLYRLNGDLNPLHVDPEFAAMVGFERPILHGLATYGIVARDVVEHLLDGDETRVAAYEVRFAGTLTPGETLRTSVWREGDTWSLVATCPEREDAMVLSHAAVRVRVTDRSDEPSTPEGIR
jgi:acyl dehydratase